MNLMIRAMTKTCSELSEAWEQTRDLVFFIRGGETTLLFVDRASKMIILLKMKHAKLSCFWLSF